MFKGEDLLKQRKEAQRLFRWQKASMIFQAAQNALNPTMKISDQLKDSIWDHNTKMKKTEIQKENRRIARHGQTRQGKGPLFLPHQLSGGMRQRVIIAMSMVLDPELLILDEPTTALDMITQHYIFDILTDIQKKKNLSMILITHDIGIAAKLAQNIVVMYGGEIMEVAQTEKLFEKPLHPYTKGLLGAIPFIDGEVVKKKPIEGSPPDLIHKTQELYICIPLPIQT